MSPTLWPFTGHTVGPHHITAAARNSQILGKRGKKHKGGVGGGGEKQERVRVCVGVGGGVTKTKAEIKNKVYH